MSALQIQIDPSYGLADADPLPAVSEPPVMADEEERLKVLSRYECAGAAVGDTLNRVVSLAATLFRVPIALVTLVGRDSQCFVGRVGMEAEGTARSISFCAYTIAAGDIFTVADAAVDPRFANNPLVIGDPRIRFYAGAPLLSPLGHRLGALCIIDRNTRPLLTFSEKGLLTQLAALATSHLDDRRNDHEQPQTVQNDADLSGFPKRVDVSLRPAARASTPLS